MRRCGGIPGTFDDAVRKAADEAEVQGWHVISDTAGEDGPEAPRDVMQGYALLIDEACAAICRRLLACVRAGWGRRRGRRHLRVSLGAIWR